MRRAMHIVIVGLMGLLSGCVFISGNLNPFRSAPQPLQEHVVSGEGRAKILLLDISNVISNAEEKGPFGLGQRPGMTARVREQLDKAAKDDGVKALILRINSPGGTVTASDMIFHDIMELKAKRHIPVVAQLLDMGTSGAYYAALAADEIVASPTTVTGSVGVILVGINLSGLMDKIGVKNQTLKTGERKDAGSPLRPMTVEDSQLLQSVLADLQMRFVDTVHERRPRLSSEALRMIADGRIFTAGQAVALGLVDRVGYLDETIKSIEAHPDVGAAQVIIYRRSQEFAETIYANAPAAPAQMNLVNFDFQALSLGAPQFLYMWLPAGGAF